ncbi:inositol monophosphatase family protein [Halapricum desulfuricans]|uniref:fructose-bisphosphatase n=1 Tax=Halapricum desulfuricans TaxID=2841257 RepID=A0A897MXF5_9EURY|nr:inositol monophosphatase [Halapricum desulfuricans]QSG05134.1 Archaeal fructose-1,6-bisphosphatase or related enzyme of inositol monophosphatase family [Halapricum desulfuricans]
MSDLLTVAERAADAGAEFAIERFRRDVAVETKSTAMDLVTEVDRRAQERIVDVVREHDPDATIVAEEDDFRKTVPDRGEAWVIDPIDGTTNFVHGLLTWGPAVAVVRDGDPVAGAVVAPAREERYLVGPERATGNGDPLRVSDRSDPDSFVVAPILRYTGSAADRDRFAALTTRLVTELGDVRRLGSAQVTLALVAAGVLDATIGPFPPNAWDTVAGALMVERAGGTVTDLAGEPWTPDSDAIVATNGEAHDAVLDRLDGFDE